MTATAFLERFKLIENMIEKKKAKIERLSALASGTTSNNSGDRVQSSGSQQRMADAVEECIDLEREVKQLEQQKHKVKCEILNTMQPLDNHYRTFLIALYIDGLTLGAVAVKHKKTYSWATTMHKRAKERLQILLDQKRGDCE